MKPHASAVRKLLTKHIAGFKRLAKFSPYVAGEHFTQADCAAYVNLPLVGMATKAVYGEDLLAAAGIDWKAYTKLIGAAAKRATHRGGPQGRHRAHGRRSQALIRLQVGCARTAPAASAAVTSLR